MYIRNISMAFVKPYKTITSNKYCDTICVSTENGIDALNFFEQKTFDVPLEVLLHDYFMIITIVRKNNDL